MIYVLTEEYNDYDQHGEYFLHAWDHPPSLLELRERGFYGDYEHLNAGGGRTSKYEDQWFFLREIT